MKRMPALATVAMIILTLGATGAFCQNLIKNGSFEFPYPQAFGGACSDLVSVANGWCLAPSGTPGLEWTVVWAETVGGSLAGSPGNIELWRGTVVAPTVARHGDQLMEFDTGGRPGTSNANVRISQSVNTCPGAQYQLKYSWMPRPGVAASSQTLAAAWAGTTLATHTGFGTPWSDQLTLVTGQFGLKQLEFTGGGTGDQLGMLLDDVSLGGPDPAVANACTTINIKPGSDPNSINTCSKGTTPVAIWGSATFNVRTIDPSSLLLGGAKVNMPGKSGKWQCSIGDAGSPSATDYDHMGLPDGYPDMICHFQTAPDMFAPGATSATVTMRVCSNGFEESCSGKPSTLITSTDAVNLVKQGCK